jgi:MFS family permease
MYSGALLGIFFMSLVGDVLGRKTLMLANLTLMLIGLGLTIFCVNLWMAGIGMFLCVLGGKNNFNLCLVFTAETVG